MKAGGEDLSRTRYAYEGKMGINYASLRRHPVRPSGLAFCLAAEYEVLETDMLLKIRCDLRMKTK